MLRILFLPVPELHLASPARSEVESSHSKPRLNSPFALRQGTSGLTSPPMDNILNVCALEHPLRGGLPTACAEADAAKMRNLGGPGKGKCRSWLSARWGTLERALQLFNRHKLMCVTMFLCFLGACSLQAAGHHRAHWTSHAHDWRHCTALVGPIRLMWKMMLPERPDPAVKVLPGYCSVLVQQSRNGTLPLASVTDASATAVGPSAGARPALAPAALLQEMYSTSPVLQPLLLAIDQRESYGQATNRVLEVDGLLAKALQLGATPLLPPCISGVPIYEVVRWQPAVHAAAKAASRCWSSLDVRALAPGLNVSHGTALPVRATSQFRAHSRQHPGVRVNAASGEVGWLPGGEKDKFCLLKWRLGVAGQQEAAHVPLQPWPDSYSPDDAGLLQARQAAERDGVHHVEFLGSMSIFREGRDAVRVSNLWLSHNLHAMAAWMVTLAFGPGAAVAGVHVRRGDWAAACGADQNCLVTDAQYTVALVSAMQRHRLRHVYVASNDAGPFVARIRGCLAAGGPTPAVPVAKLDSLQTPRLPMLPHAPPQPFSAQLAPSVVSLADVLPWMQAACAGWPAGAPAAERATVRVQDPLGQNVYDYSLAGACANLGRWQFRGKLSMKYLGWLDKAILSLLSCVIGTPRSTFSSHVLHQRQLQFGFSPCDHIATKLLPSAWVK